jgi:hypothetical protein
MEVNQILMMPASFGGWQFHDDNLICFYIRYDHDSDAYIYFLLVPPSMLNFDSNGLWSAADLWSLTGRTNSIATGYICI